MKNKILFFLLLSILVLSAFSVAQNINGRFSTSFYTWEKFDTVDQSNIITRIYQNAEVNASFGDVSLHTFLNGATGGIKSLSDNGQVRVYNAYLQWKNIGGVLEARLGRVPVFAGVGNGIIDGALFKSEITSQLTVTGYGGGNVSTALRSKAFDNIKDNYFVGGQVVGKFIEGMRLGLSYMNRQREVKSYWAVRSDSAYNPVTMLIEPPARKEQVIGADVSYEFGNNYSVYGRFDYELNRDEILKGEIDGRVRLNSDLTMTGTFIHRTPKIFYNTFFTLFPSESVEEFEGGIEYAVCPWANAIGRVAYVQYDDDQSMRYTAGVSTNYGGFQYAGTSGFAGKLHSISFDAVYPFFDRLITPTIGATYSLYELSDGSGKSESMIAAVAGIVVRPMKTISIDIQTQWIENKIMENDLRVFGRVSYWFSHQFSNPE
ncbi:MAG: hypothetical protein HZB59_03370 [Ignavibacteriales bacterium]|nr:hypothetical protein [Ignavibacteriales bacterium]